MGCKIANLLMGAPDCPNGGELTCPTIVQNVHGTRHSCLLTPVLAGDKTECYCFRGEAKRKPRDHKYKLEEEEGVHSVVR